MAKEKKEKIQEEEKTEAVKEETAAAPAAEEPEEKEAEAPLTEWEKKIQELEEQLARQKDQFLRTAAEYDNFRKRTEREKAAIYNDATAVAVAQILPVEDNLERALAQADCSAEDLRKGVQMVQTQMRESLKKLGVAEMGAEGEAFNPDLHNAVMHVEDEALEENVIVEVFQKGYILGEKVIRHAMVKVAN